MSDGGARVRRATLDAGKAGSALAWVPVGVATGTVLSLFGPWVRSGASRRTSFETLRTAARLGQLDGGALRVLAALCVFLPALMAAAWMVKLVGRTRVAVAMSVAVALGCGLLGLAVRSAGVLVDWGPAAAMAGALATVLTAVLWSLLSAPGGRPR